MGRCSIILPPSCPLSLFGFALHGAQRSHQTGFHQAAHGTSAQSPMPRREQLDLRVRGSDFKRYPICPSASMSTTEINEHKCHEKKRGYKRNDRWVWPECWKKGSDMEQSWRGDREQTLSASQDTVKKTCFSLAELKT